MATIGDHIRTLESYVERSGARLVRSALPESVHGRVFGYLITLARLGLPRRAASGQCSLHDDSPTDGLLLASVTRVIWAGGRICDALGVGTEQDLEP